MTSAGPLSVDVSQIRRRPGRRRAVTGAVHIDDLALSTLGVPDGRVEVDLELEAVGDEIVVTGSVQAPWQGPCRRCLEPVDGTADLRIREICEARPTEGETYPIVDDRVDLEPVVREAVLLALPSVPLCDDGCLGPAPDEFPALGAARDDEVPAGRDPRWAALDELTFDEP